MKKLIFLPLTFFFYFGCEDAEEDSGGGGSAPGPLTLSLSNNVLTWTMNNDDDFSKYRLIGSITTQSPISPAITWDTLVYETQTTSDTSYTLDSSEFYCAYQVTVTNNSDLTSFSSLVSGWTRLWGKYYFIDDTDSLMLGSAGLTDSIPPQIGTLTNLTVISIVDNPLLTGPIPNEIGNLVNLTYLNLSNNNLSGLLTETIGYLTDLEAETGLYKLSYLNLSHNQLTGDLYRLRLLGGLTHLNLSHNQLSGPIPTADWQDQPPGIQDMTNLSILDLSHNEFTGDVPHELGDLNMLTRLRLNNNKLTGTPVGLNEVTGEIESTICNLNLTWTDTVFFNLSNNKICAPYPTCIEEHMGEQDTADCN